MSLIPIGTSILTALAIELLSPALFRVRSIGDFVADVTVEEDGTDELDITGFPVEQGAEITDHAFKRPASVKILVGYSNSSPTSGGNPNYVQDIYQQFLDLQASRTLFDVYTGKRVYQNMLMQRLYQHTDQKIENALLMTVECRQVILTETQTVTVPKAGDMKNPEITGPTVNGGSQSLQPGSQFNSSAASADGISVP
jgi:hypothetical protein